MDDDSVWNIGVAGEEKHSVENTTSPPEGLNSTLETWTVSIQNQNLALKLVTKNSVSFKLSVSMNEVSFQLILEILLTCKV